MKLLMIYTEKFGYNPAIKNLEQAETVEEAKEYSKSLVGFIQAEEKDIEDIPKIETKLVKNLKWAAKKNNTNTIILHSFAHLSESKATPEVTRQLFDNAEKRLLKAGYLCSQTPFGYFLDLDIKAPGKSLARIFKDF